MGRQLMRITPGILAAAKEYQQLKHENRLPKLHVAECYPIPPDAVLRYWDAAQSELRRRGCDKQFKLAYVTVFKEGDFAAEYLSVESTTDEPSLFA